MEVGGFVEIGDGGNGGNVGDGVKILGHDVIVGRGEGNDLVFVFVVITHVMVRRGSAVA